MSSQLPRKEHVKKRLLAFVLCRCLDRLRGRNAGEGGVIEGATEYRLANGLRILTIPTRARARYRAHHLLRRRAQRGLRRDRHGAPAGAHDVQGHAEQWRTSSRTGQARRALQRQHADDRTTISRPSGDRTTTSTGRSAWKPTAWSFHVAQVGPRQRDDGGAQRIREWARTAPAACSGSARCAPAFHGHNYGNDGDRRPLRHRNGADRPPAGVLPHELPARQRAADHRRPVRRGKGARAGGEDSARSRATRVLPATYTIEPVQDGEREVTLRARGRRADRVGVYHVPPPAHLKYPAVDIWRDHEAPSLPAGCTGRWSQKGRPATPGAASACCTTRAYASFGSDAGKGRSARAAARRCSRRCEGPGSRTDADAEVERARTALERNGQSAGSILADAADLPESVGHGRLAAVLPAPRPACEK